NDLVKAVARLRVDQRFVEAKITRLQGARGTAKLSDIQRGEIEKLLKDVTSAFSDGRYEQANKGLNRIAVILDAGSASGYTTRRGRERRRSSPPARPGRSGVRAGPAAGALRAAR